MTEHAADQSGRTEHTMIYQEHYQAGGDPAKLNISTVFYICPPEYLPAQNDPALREHGFPAHCHSFYEINYCPEGSAMMESDNRLITLTPGSMTFYPPLTIHRIQNDTRPCQLVLQFSFELIKNIFSSSSQNFSLVPDGKLLEDGKLTFIPGTPAYDALQEILRLSRKQHLFTPEADEVIAEYPPEIEMQLTAALFGLLSAFIKDGCLRIAPSEGLNASRIIKMQSLLTSLISSPEEKCSMEKAASMLNMSYSNFCRTFKHTIGMSYVDFCNMIRVRRAQELLRHTDMSVTDISVLLNFGSISYFNRIFKKLTGFTPLNYRAAA